MIARNWAIKYEKSSYQLCSATGDSSVLLGLMSKQCMAVASGPAGRVLAGAVFDLSKSTSAHALVRCNPIKHQGYPTYQTSIIRRLRIGSCTYLSPYHSHYVLYKAWGKLNKVGLATKCISVSMMHFKLNNL